MAEHSRSQQPDPETDSSPDKLVSRIAKAYRTLPPEEREKTLLFDARDEQVENPELDRTFDQLLQTYARKPGERGQATVHMFPAPVSPQTDGEEESPADQENTPAGPYECPECGHANPQENRFCGMCGALYEDAGSPAARGAAPGPGADLPVPRTEPVQHHHHHHYHREVNRYLAALVIAVAVFLVWQQWRTFRAAVDAAPALAVPARSVHAAVPAPPVSPTVATPSASSASRTSMSTRKTGRADRRLKAAASAGSAAAERAPARGANRGNPPAPVVESVTQQITPGPPAASHGRNDEDTVVLQALIGKDGSVSHVQVLSGPPQLASAALDAVRLWRARPYMVGGEPVEISTTLTIRFATPAGGGAKTH